MFVRVFDLLTHHRHSVIKAAATSFPGGRGAQKMVAANFRRYSREKEKVGAAGAFRIVGESFMRASDKARWISSDLFKNLEQGANIGSADPMLIPIGKGLTTRKWADMIKSKALTVIQRPGKPALLVKFIGPRRSGKLRGFGGNAELFGVLTHSRRQRPILGFFAGFDRVLPRHLAKMDRSLDRLLTEAGRAANAKEVFDVGGGTEDTFVRRLLKYGYGGDPETRAFVGRMAALEARDSLTPAGGAA